MPEAEAAQAEAPRAEAPEAGVITDEPAAGDLAGDELAGEDAAGHEQAGGDLAGDDLAGDVIAGDDLAGDEPTGDELAGDEQVTADANAGQTADDAAAAGPDAASAGPDAAAPRRSPLLVPACLGALAAVLGGLAVWFSLEAGSVTSGVDTANTALTNPTATSQVSQQVASAVDTIFSYNYADTAKTSQAAASLLTAGAKTQYDTLFKLVRQDAPTEKLVVTTTVTNSGVEYLIGDQARVLVFANQQSIAGTGHKTTDAGAMLAVNAVYQGGRWKIAHIDTFGAAG